MSSQTKRLKSPAVFALVVALLIGYFIGNQIGFSAGFVTGKAYGQKAQIDQCKELDLTRFDGYLRRLETQALQSGGTPKEELKFTLDKRGMKQ